MNVKTRAPRNRTLVCSEREISGYSRKLLRLSDAVEPAAITRRLILGDFFEASELLPSDFVDLLILDPPYNLTKHYNGRCFKKRSAAEYRRWFEDIISRLAPMMRDAATLYVCSDWKTSAIVQPVLEERFAVRNRITWEREKGRGAKNNWKNGMEDIWFCTKSDDYHFDVESVKLKRRVVAPYRKDGSPKDWAAEDGGNFRLTHPSNLWTDLTVPFWSMPENTAHPAQKPEKLIAKLILASSRRDDFVFDPFVGSGTTAVVAEKLGRRWCGIDADREYLCLAAKRVDLAGNDGSIQGYRDNVFWERNSGVRPTAKK